MRPQGSPPKADPPLREVFFVPMWRYALVGVRGWLERNGMLAPRPGRQNVWAAKDRGELVSPQMQVQQDDAGSIVVPARPKARMTMRVYRAATGTWSDYKDVEAVEVSAASREE